MDICPSDALSITFDPSVTEAEIKRISSKFKSLEPEAQGDDLAI